MEHVMAVSTITDDTEFWNGLKRAHGRLPKGAKWKLAVASTDGTKAVNILTGESVAAVKDFFDTHTGASAATEFFAADAANAVGLPK
jgi:hypothetical protein